MFSSKCSSLKKCSPQSVLPMYHHGENTRNHCGELMGGIDVIHGNKKNLGSIFAVKSHVYGSTFLGMGSFILLI